MNTLLYFLLQANNEHPIGDIAEKLGGFIASALMYALPFALLIFLVLFLIKKMRK